MYQLCSTNSDAVVGPLHAGGKVGRLTDGQSKSVKRVVDRVVGTRSALGTRSQSRRFPGLSKVFVGRNSKAQGGGRGNR